MNWTSRRIKNGAATVYRDLVAYQGHPPESDGSPFKNEELYTALGVQDNRGTTLFQNIGVFTFGSIRPRYVAFGPLKGAVLQLLRGGRENPRSTLEKLNRHVPGTT